MKQLSLFEFPFDYSEHFSRQMTFDLRNYSIEQLSEYLLNSEKYLWFINVPGRFDIAEFLNNYFWNYCSTKVKKRIEDVLLYSGKYIKSV